MQVSYQYYVCLLSGTIIGNCSLNLTQIYSSYTLANTKTASKITILLNKFYKPDDVMAFNLQHLS